jgi:hypothetical protein
MDTLTTEEQQIAAIKQWCKENGSSIVTGVVLGLAVLFGGKAWFAYQERNAQSASNIFAVMLGALQNGDALNAGEKAGMLLADYGSTPYGHSERWRWPASGWRKVSRMLPAGSCNGCSITVTARSSGISPACAWRGS